MSSIQNVVNFTMNATDVVDAVAVFGPQRDPLYIVLPITIIYSIIFVTGLFGNVFTCLVIMRNKNMHTATNFYLFSLAISDLLLLVSGMPQEMYTIWSKWPYVFGPAFCLIRGLAAEMSTNASVLTITLFTIERYLAICHPFVSHKMSKLSRATKHVLMLWVVALGLALPQALQFGIRNYRGVTMCLQVRVLLEHSFEISTFFFFFAPMVLITVLYTLIGIKLKKTSLSKTTRDSKLFERSVCCAHKIHRRQSQATRRVVKMLVAVVVAFFVCWAPFHAQRLVAIYGTTEDHMARSPILLQVYSFLTYTSGIFYYMSTCINPIFYHIMSNKFREAFKNTFRQWCCLTTKSIEVKRCSNTALGIVKNATSSDTEKFLRDDGMKRNGSSREGSVNKGRKHVMDQLVCPDCKKVVSGSSRGNQPPSRDHGSTKKNNNQKFKEIRVNNENNSKTPFITMGSMNLPQLTNLTETRNGKLEGSIHSRNLQDVN